MCPRKHGEIHIPIEKVKMTQPIKEAEKKLSRIDIWKKDLNILKSFFGEFDENNPVHVHECSVVLNRIDDLLSQVEYSVASPDKQAICFRYEPKLSVGEKKNLEDIFVELFIVIGGKLTEVSDLRVASWLEATMNEICETYEMVFGVHE